LRKKYEIFRREDFFDDTERDEDREIKWQAEKPGELDWAHGRKFLGFTLRDVYTKGTSEIADFFVMVNSGEDATCTLPEPRKGYKWFQIINTAMDSPQDILEDSHISQVRSADVKVTSMSAMVLVSRRRKK
jgi:pullulanase/glycogen debranching enzyme